MRRVQLVGTGRLSARAPVFLSWICYIRLSVPERRKAVAELAAEGMSTREAGEVLGVGKSTVAEDVAAVHNRTAEPDNPPEDGDDEPDTVRNRTAEPDNPPEDGDDEPDTVRNRTAEPDDPPEDGDDEPDTVPNGHSRARRPPGRRGRRARHCPK